MYGTYIFPIHVDSMYLFTICWSMQEGPDVSKKRKSDSHLDNDNKMPHDSEELEYDAYKDDDLGMEQEYGDDGEEQE